MERFAFAILAKVMREGCERPSDVDRECAFGTTHDLRPGSARDCKALQRDSGFVVCDISIRVALLEEMGDWLAEGYPTSTIGTST